MKIKGKVDCNYIDYILLKGLEMKLYYTFIINIFYVVYTIFDKSSGTVSLSCIVWIIFSFSVSFAAGYSPKFVSRKISWFSSNNEDFHMLRSKTEARLMS